MPTSPKATTMPGGAPLRSSSKRPCKYGPRVDGLCPKKPKATKAAKPASSRSKPPCKYGPRGADGYCPKKPKAAAKAPTVKQLTSVSGASRQAGEVLRSKKATTSQKKEAVKVLGAAVAGEATKKVGESVAREAKKAVRQNKGAIKKAAKTVAGSGALAAGARAGVVGAAIAGTLAAGGAALSANRRREAAAFAKAQLARTKSKLPKGALSAAQEKTLYDQYYQFALSKPVTNPYSGK